MVFPPQWNFMVGLSAMAMATADDGRRWWWWKIPMPKNPLDASLRRRSGAGQAKSALG